MINGPMDRSSAAEAAVWDALHTVVDPELGASLVDLGMIRAVRVAAPTATIEPAPTMPGCLLADWLEDQVCLAIFTDSWHSYGGRAYRRRSVAVRSSRAVAALDRRGAGTER